MKQMASKLHAEMLCVDDKAVIPLGEPDKPVSTGVRAHHKSLSLTSSKLMSHVFGLVLFHIDVPDDYRDSFYTEKVHVIVKDKVLEASSPVRHATENASILREIK